MSGEEDLSIVESGDTQLVFDNDTQTVREPGKKEPRDAFPHESVRAVVQQRKAEADERHPLMRHLSRWARNGRDPAGMLDQIAEFDSVVQRDPVAAVGHVVDRLGFNRQAVAQHLYNGTTPHGTAHEAIERDAIEAGERFYQRHPDMPPGHPLRNAGANLIARRDPRLHQNSAKTVDELYERAVSLAWQDLPQNRARLKASEILDSRDRERENAAKDTATARVQRKMNSRLG